MEISSRCFSAPKLWPADERDTRHPSWTELFYDLVFAAAISQVGTPLGADFSLHGVVRYAFLLSLVFLAWLGYTKFTTQFAIDDVVQRVFVIAQIFLVAVMAANATGPLSSRDAAGFGAAYGGVRAVLALQYFRVAKLPATRAMVVRRIIGLVIAALIWTASALLPAPQRYFAWSFALAIDVANTWLPTQCTKTSPPGAVHFPERFGLLTIILLGEFVASVMRGIESQMGWSFLAASAAILSIALGFALWSGYSDGAAGWETRHIRSNKEVASLRIWIALHYFLFLGIGILGIGARRGIALQAGEHFPANEQALICAAAAAIVLIITGIAATSDRHLRSFTMWTVQLAIAVIALFAGIMMLQLPAAATLLLLFGCFVGQTAFLVVNQTKRRSIAEI